MKQHNKLKTTQAIKVNRNLQADINRAERHIRYCEWVVAACVGASIALAFVIAHQMIVTEWTW